MKVRRTRKIARNFDWTVGEPVQQHPDTVNRHQVLTIDESSSSNVFENVKTVTIGSTEQTISLRELIQRVRNVVQIAPAFQNLIWGIYSSLMHWYDSICESELNTYLKSSALRLLCDIINHISNFNAAGRFVLANEETIFLNTLTFVSLHIQLWQFRRGFKTESEKKEFMEYCKTMMKKDLDDFLPYTRGNNVNLKKLTEKNVFYKCLRCGHMLLPNDLHAENKPSDSVKASECHLQPEIFNSLQCIGSGKFGDVYRVDGKLLGVSGGLGEEAVCLKLFRMEDPYFCASLDDASIEIKKHFNLLASLPDIAQIERFYFSVTADSEEGPVCGYGCELCEGTLEQAIYEVSSLARRLLDPWCYETKLKVMLECATGLAFLHNAGIRHLDLTPRNILIDAKGQVKLADFGIAGHISKTFIPAFCRYVCSCDGLIGSPPHMAPEILLSSPPNYSDASDIYALGVIFNELITESLPFADIVTAANWYELKEKFRQDQRPVVCAGNHSVNALIQRMWVTSPDKRPLTQSVVYAVKAILLWVSECCEANTDNDEGFELRKRVMPLNSDLSKKGVSPHPSDSTADRSGSFPLLRIAKDQTESSDKNCEPLREVITRGKGDTPTDNFNKAKGAESATLRSPSDDYLDGSWKQTIYERKNYRRRKNKKEFYIGRHRVFAAFESSSVLRDQVWEASHYSQRSVTDIIVDQRRRMREVNFTMRHSSILLADFEEQKILMSQGVFSKMYAAQIKTDISPSIWPVDRERRVALKLYAMDIPYQKEVLMSEEAQASFRKEARLLQLINSRYVVRTFAEVALSSDKDENCICGLVMERCAGSLRNAIYDEDSEERRLLAPWDFATKLQIVRDISEALTYIHELGVIHRDLKPDHILVDHTGRVKIAGFVASTLTSKSILRTDLTNSVPDDRLVGTRLYMAPEILFADSMMSPVHSVASDIYAFGILVNEIMDGKMPYEEIFYQPNFRELLQSGRRPSIFPLPDEAESEVVKRSCVVLRDYLDRMWHSDYQRRPSAPQLLSTVEMLLYMLRDRKTAVTIFHGNSNIANELNSIVVLSIRTAVYFVVFWVVVLLLLFLTSILLLLINGRTTQIWLIKSSLSLGGVSWCNKDSSRIFLRLDFGPGDGTLTLNHFAADSYGTKVSIPHHFLREDPVNIVVSVNETGFLFWMQGEMQYFFEHRVPWASFHHVEVYKALEVSPISRDRMLEILHNQSLQKAQWLSQYASWSVYSTFCAGALDFKSAEGHILFHFHPKITERHIVMNTRFTHLGWDIPEERVVLPHSCYESPTRLNATITVNATGFYVMYWLDEHQQVNYMYDHRVHALVASVEHSEEWEIRRLDQLRDTEHLHSAAMNTEGQLSEYDGDLL